LHSTHSFGTPSGTQSASAKPKAKVSSDNIIKTTLKHLSGEPKKEVNDMVKHYQELCIDCFTTVRGGKMVQKMEFPSPLLDGETALTPTNVNQATNSVVDHMFIDRSRALVNNLPDFMKETLEGMASQLLNNGLQCYTLGLKGAQTS
jgi:hypothetical protein